MSWRRAARRAVFILDGQGLVRYRKEEPLSLTYRSVDDLMHALADSELLPRPPPAPEQVEPADAQHP